MPDGNRRRGEYVSFCRHEQPTCCTVASYGYIKCCTTSTTETSYHCPQKDSIPPTDFHSDAAKQQPRDLRIPAICPVAEPDYPLLAIEAHQRNAVSRRPADGFRGLAESAGAKRSPEQSDLRSIDRAAAHDDGGSRSVTMAGKAVKPKATRTKATAKGRTTAKAKTAKTKTAGARS